MATSKKKVIAKTGSERTKEWKERRKNVGLREIKIFVHPDDAEATRNYAGKRPATKAALNSL